MPKKAAWPKLRMPPKPHIRDRPRAMKTQVIM